MYKVFINDKPLIITSFADAGHLVDGKVQTSYTGPSDIQWAMQLLNNVSHVKQVEIMSANPDEVLEEVKKKSG